MRGARSQEPGARSQEPEGRARGFDGARLPRGITVRAKAAGNGGAHSTVTP
jgi:hypothetical protein